MSEEVDTTAAETALLLHENIEKRIHEAVGRLFGYDAQTYSMMPRVSNDTTEHVRQAVSRELSKYIASALVYDTSFVETMFNQMETMQHNRRMQHRNSMGVSSRYF